MRYGDAQSVGKSTQKARNVIIFWRWDMFGRVPSATQDEQEGLALILGGSFGSGQESSSWLRDPSHFESAAGLP